MDKPSEERYAEIFKRYAGGLGLNVEDDLLKRLLNRYRVEQRDLRASEPRDLIERCRDICNLRQQPPAITQELLDLAWTGYFGS